MILVMLYETISQRINVAASGGSCIQATGAMPYQKIVTKLVYTSVYHLAVFYYIRQLSLMKLIVIYFGREEIN